MSAMSERRACNVYRSSPAWDGLKDGTVVPFLQAATCPAACVDPWRSPNSFGRLGGDQKCGSGETSIVAGSASFGETLITSLPSPLMHSIGQAVCSGAAAEHLPRHAAQQLEDGSDRCLATPRGLHGGTVPKFGCRRLCRVMKKATKRNRVNKAEARPAFTHHFEQEERAEDDNKMKGGERKAERTEEDTLQEAQHDLQDEQWPRLMPGSVLWSCGIEQKSSQRKILSTLTLASRETSSTAAQIVL